MTTSRFFSLTFVVIATNLLAWWILYHHLELVPRSLECRLIEYDPFGGRRYHTITTVTPGRIDESTGAIICYFK